jgi:hypothetical protein
VRGHARTARDGGRILNTVGEAERMAITNVDDQAFFINLRSQNFLQIVIDFTSGRWELTNGDASWPLEIVTLGKKRVRIHEDGTCELLDKPESKP